MDGQNAMTPKVVYWTFSMQGMKGDVYLNFTLDMQALYLPLHYSPPPNNNFGEQVWSFDNDEEDDMLLLLLLSLSSWELENVIENILCLSQ